MTTYSAALNKNPKSILIQRARVQPAWIWLGHLTYCKFMHHAHASLTIHETVLFDVENESLSFQQTKHLTNISGLLRIIEGIHCLFGECRGRRDASHLETPVANNRPWQRALEVTSVYLQKRCTCSSSKTWKFEISGGPVVKKKLEWSLRSTLETPCYFGYPSTH